MDFSGGTNDKKSTCQCMRLKRLGFSPWVGKMPWRSVGYTCLSNILVWRSQWTEEPGGLQSIGS